MSAPPKETPAKENASGWSDAEKQADARMRELVERVKQLDSEIRINEGRAHLANPALVQAARTETERLKKRLGQLTRALWIALRDDPSPRDLEEAKTGAESLRQTSIDYFAKLNLNADLWKNIASS